MIRTAAFFFAILISSSLYALPQYELIDLGTLDENFSYAHAINEHGQITGSFGDLNQSRQHNPTSTFIGDPQGIQPLLELADAYDSSGTDINDHGLVLGSVAQNSEDNYRSFLYRNGHIKYLSPSLSATSINNKGQLTGSAERDGGASHAFISHGNRITTLDESPADGSFGNAINDHGQIAATVYNGTSRLAAYGDKDGLLTLPGLNPEHTSEARDINNHGVMTGYIYADGIRSSFLADKQGLIVPDIGQLEGNTNGLALNDHNHIVGSSHADGGEAAILWTPEDKLGRLSDLVTDMSGWYELARAEDINNRGQIVGLGIRENYELHGFMLDPVVGVSVSGPRQVFLLLIGLGFLVLNRRPWSSC